MDPERTMEASDKVCPFGTSQHPLTRMLFIETQGTVMDTGGIRMLEPPQHLGSLGD